MLQQTARQQEILSSKRKLPAWLFTVTDKNSNRYYWSTRNIKNTEEHGDYLKWADGIEWDTGIKWDTGGDNQDANNAFEFKITEFSGITLRRGSAESGLQAPNDIQFTVINKDNTLSADDFKGGTIWVHQSLKDDIGSDIIRRFRFRIKKVTPGPQKLKFFAEDFIQEHLRGYYPNTPLVDSLWPSDDQKNKDNLCVPVPFGTTYVPLRSVYITDQRYYVLGPSSYTYNISAVHSPAGTPESEWTSGSFDFNQYTKQDAGSNNWRVFQPIIADSDTDGTADACGLFKPGDVFLDMPTKFTRSDTASMTNPAYAIDFVLKDFGIPANDINQPAIAAAAAIFDAWGLTFNGAFFRKTDRRSVLTQLLTMCNSILVIGEQIELRVLSADSVKTITKTDVVRPSLVGEGTFKYSDITNETDSDSGYAAFQEAGKPQDRLLKILVPSKSSTDNPSSDVLEMPFVQNSQHVQKLASLHFQRKYLKKANVSYDSKTTLLALHPDDVITINHADYGGNYKVLVDTIKISKDRHLSFSCVQFKQDLDDWEDLTFGSVTPATDDSTDMWQYIMVGPDSTLPGGKNPNLLPGPLRIGSTENYILLDPAEPIIKLIEGSIERLLIGDLAASNLGVQVNDGEGNTVFKVDSNSAFMLNITINYTESDAFKINQLDHDVDTQLIFGRTTGGVAYITWNGVLMQTSKPLKPTDLGINRISATEPSSTFAGMVWLDAS